jgi:hypothetical protein
MAEMGKDNDAAGTPTGAADIRKAVEGANALDENQDEDADDADDEDSDDSDNNQGDDAGDADDNDGSDDGDDADEDQDDSDKSKPDEKKDPKSRKFTQFAGDGTEEAYLSNLEKGYTNSSAEALRLKGDLDQATGRVDAIMQAAATDPELATKLNAALNGAGAAGGTGEDKNSQGSASDNPFVRNLQADWQEKSETEIAAFIEANPEVATDPTISADVKHWMKVFSNDKFERTGKLMTGGEAMTAAYKHLGLENKLGKQSLADGAKKNLTPTRSRGKAKKSSGQKPTYTADQLAFAQSMGHDEAWLQKNAK